ncbi:MAG: hypothetical protein RLZZ407_1929, partial [Pseudomonadota bacterium]
HVPSSKYHNVKEPNRFDPVTTDKKADTYGSLIFTTRGVGDLFVGDRTAETLASRPVRGPLKRLRDSVNSHLQFYYKKNAVRRNFAVFRGLRRDNGWAGHRFREV